MPYPPPEGIWVKLISRVSLVALAHHKGFTVRTLAAAAKTNRSTVGHLMSGKRDSCSRQSAKAIAKALDVPTDALFRTEMSTVAPAIRRRRVA